MKLTIDPEFKALIPPLSSEEFALLEANIQRDGCRDPLTVWGDTLLDGHNRHEICTKHDLPYLTFQIELPDRDAAMDWMDANQLGRRNLSKEAHDLLLGRRYNRTKKTKAEAQSLSVDARNSKDQNDTCKDNTAAKLAVEHGVSEATVKRAGQFAEAVEAQGLEAEAMSGKLKGKKKEVVEAHRKANGKAKAEEEEPEPLVVDGVKFPLPNPTLSDDAKAKGDDAEKDSDKLWLLKSTWRSTNKKDKASFLAWVSTK
jgi:hypothetical protein